MNHPDEQRLMEFASGHAADAKAIEQHLAECAACRESVDAVRRVVAAASAMEVPEPDGSFEARLWRGVRAELEPRPAPAGWREWFSMRRLAAATAVATVVLAAFLAGRFWPRPAETPAPVAAVTPQVKERILLVAVGDHLDRAQSILLEISNAEPAAGAGSKNVDISHEQKRAEELLGANRLYRQTALRTGDAPVADVLDQLEPLLVELANGPAEVPASELEALQKRIAARGLLLKVRVVSSNVREKERSAVEQGRNSS